MHFSRPWFTKDQSDILALQQFHESYFFDTTIMTPKHKSLDNSTPKKTNEPDWVSKLDLD